MDTQITTKKDCRIKMLVMTFITFACIVLLPLYTLEDYAGLNIYVSDLTSFSTATVSANVPESGSLVRKMEQLEASTPEAEKTKALFIQFSGPFESAVIEFLTVTKTSAILILVTLITMLLSFCAMIYAGVKNSKTIYRIAAAVILIILFAIPIIASEFITLDISSLISGGSAFGIIMLILDFFLPFKDPKTKNA